MEEVKSVHYDAFISYKHSELDSFVAENIHKKLERFRLPKSAQSKVKNGKKKIERVFRDVDELPLADNLSDPINLALKNSDFLIAICTPRYLESRWCMKEIEEFLKTHDRRKILVVLAEDEPCNSFPEILTYEEVVSKDENGNEFTYRKEIEPLAADTRGSNKKEILKAIDIAVIKLCAEIFGLNYDDLRQRQRRQKIQRMALIFGTIGAALLMFAIFAAITLVKLKKLNNTITSQYEDLQKKNITIASQNAELEENNKTITSQYKDLEEKNETIASQNKELEENNKIIAEQYSELQDKYASSMSLVAEDLIGSGRKKDAVYVLERVLSGTESYNSDAIRNLYSVMDTYKIDKKYSPEAFFDDIYLYTLSYDGNLVAICNKDGIGVYDTGTGEIIKKIDNDSCYMLGFCGTSGIISIGNDGPIYDSIMGTERIILDEILNYESIDYFVVADDGRVTLLISENYVFALDNNGSLMYSIKISEVFQNDTGNIENDHAEESFEKADSLEDIGITDDEDLLDSPETWDDQDFFESPEVWDDEDSFNSPEAWDDEGSFYSSEDWEDDDFWYFDNSDYSFVDSDYADGRILLCMNDFSHYYFFMIDEYSGEILSALIENMSGDVKVLLDGDMIYYTCEQYVTYGGETENVISLRAYNMTLGAYMFAPRNYQKFAVNDILVNSDCIFIYDNNMVVVLDKKTGDPLNIYSTVNKIVFGWIMKDRLYYLFDNGSLYMCDNKWMYDQSEKFFSHIPSGTRITDAHFIDEKLYCMFNSDYLVRYSNDINSDAIAVEEKYEWERNEDSVTSDPREIFTIPRKEKDIIKDAVFSEDKKFILAEYENAIYKILDTESGDVRYVFRSDSLYDDDQNFIYMKLSYNEIFGKYVLHTKKHSYVFNDDFNILCVTPRIVDGLDDRLIMLDDSGKAYSVPYVSPEELVQQTQNALIGYEPLANILQEYNIRN